MKKSKSKYEIEKAIDKIEVIQDEITLKGLSDSFCEYVSRELEGPIRAIKAIKAALENN